MRLGRHAHVIFMNVKLNDVIDDMLGTSGVRPLDGRITMHTAIERILDPKYQVPSTAVAFRFVRMPPFYASKISRINTGIFVFTENQTNVQWHDWDPRKPLYATILDA